MKLPKLLLGAMLASITVTTVSSCKKEKEVTPATQQEEGNPNEEVNHNPDNCPACGMG